jgi:transcriptional regulator with XRE-family HTH domain
MENMAKQKTYSRPFSKAVDYYVRIKALTNNDLAKAVGYPNGQMIQAIRNERSNGGESKRRAIAQYFGFSLDDFIQEGERLIMKQEQEDSPAPDTGNLTHIDQQHADVIKKFQNRELALEINSELVGLEYIDPSRLEKVLDYIKEQKVVASFETNQKKSPGTASGE